MCVFEIQLTLCTQILFTLTRRPSVLLHLLLTSVRCSSQIYIHIYNTAFLIHVVSDLIYVDKRNAEVKAKRAAEAAAAAKADPKAVYFGCYHR